MTTATSESRTHFKSFTYRTSVVNVSGRAGELRSEGKPSLKVASPPEFKGHAGVWTPEDLFVASVEICLMLTFVGVAEKLGVRFASYESDAEGSLVWEQASYRFVTVTVRPRIVVHDDATLVSAHEALERAHRTCLVANSLRCEVLVEPAITVERTA